MRILTVNIQGRSLLALNKQAKNNRSEAQPERSPRQRQTTQGKGHCLRLILAQGGELLQLQHSLAFCST